MLASAMHPCPQGVLLVHIFFQAINLINAKINFFLGWTPLFGKRLVAFACLICKKFLFQIVHLCDFEVQNLTLDAQILKFKMICTIVS